MNEGTRIVNPVLAILATPEFKQQQRRQNRQKRAKKTRAFDSFFHTACDAADDTLLPNEIGCYGRDAKPVVGNVSSFNRIL